MCDGAFFKGETIAVIGGGDAAVEEADYLTRYAEKVYVIHRRDEFRASKILQERLFANPKIEVIWNKRVLELIGTPAGLQSLLLEDTLTGDRTVLEATGCFVFIGFRPNTGLVKEHFAHDANDLQALQIGYIGIAVALLGRNTAIGTVAAALLFGALISGTSQRNLDPTIFEPSLAKNLTFIIQGLVVLIVSADVLVLGMIRRGRGLLARGRAAPAPAAEAEP